jgi:hypothetical protein
VVSGVPWGGATSLKQSNTPLSARSCFNSIMRVCSSQTA